MRLRLSPVASDLFITVFVMATLYWRFTFESDIQGYFLISMGIGAFFLLFLWALVKVKFLNPSWFGLLDEK
ncbi:MAG: hypothetical protein R2769_03645 [Saprospiraceae bacterium]